jgi:hypothetical protein
VKVVHYNPKGRPIGGGRNNWLTTLQGYATKFDPTIDDTHRQLAEKLEAIKEALDMTFEYLDHPLAYNWVKDKVVVVLKSRQAYLKIYIENGLDQPHNCEEHHWNQLKEVLAQEDNVEKAIRMKGIQTTQNNASQIG